MPGELREDRYAVVGNPVAHSLSPRIHSAFARQTGEALSYAAIELPLEGFSSGIAQLQQRGFSGVNVTVPFKREAWKLCHQLTARAQIAGAVNTLTFHPGGEIHGDNTDGVGLVRDLTDNLKLAIAGKNLLLLGAGGAVRGVLQPLLELAPASLTIANRRLERAAGLAADFTSSGKIRAVAYTQLKPEGYHLIINGTAAGLSNQIPPISPAVLGSAVVCYDMMYKLDSATTFVEWTLAQGVKQSHDGLGMLVEQAAEAFSLWRGTRPDTGQVMALLKAS